MFFVAIMSIYYLQCKELELNSESFNSEKNKLKISSFSQDFELHGDNIRGDYSRDKKAIKSAFCGAKDKRSTKEVKIVDPPFYSGFGFGLDWHFTKTNNFYSWVKS